MSAARSARHVVLPGSRLLAVAYTGPFDERALMEVERVIWRDPRWSPELDAVFDARSAELDLDAAALSHVAAAAADAGRRLRGQLIDVLGDPAAPRLAPAHADPDARLRTAKSLDDALRQLCGGRASRVRSELDSLRWAITLPYSA